MKELCGAWMPRAKETCASGAGHKEKHRSAAAVECQRIAAVAQRAYDQAEYGEIPAPGTDGLCWEWMPRAKQPCARGAGHKGEHLSAAGVERKRDRKRELRDDPEYAKNELVQQREYKSRRWLTDSDYRARQLDDKRRRAGWFEPGEMATLEEVRRLFDGWKL